VSFYAAKATVGILRRGVGRERRPWLPLSGQLASDAGLIDDPFAATAGARGSASTSTPRLVNGGDPG